ncbi:hypothetical protein GCM10009551_105890 [Nocardiopsis tropica]
MPDETSGAGPDFSSFSSEEFAAAATRLFETARPWLSAALAEHAAHPVGEPGGCRLCALGGAVARNVEPFAEEAARSLGAFADEVLADLMKLAEELMGSARTTAAAVAADYLATVRGDAPAAPPDGPVTPADGPVAAPSPSSQHTGYERIDVQLPGEPPTPASPNGEDE